MGADPQEALSALYRRLLDGWNARDAVAFADCFADDGAVIGFDGSEHRGRTLIAEQIQQIFADHATGTYVGKVRRVRRLGPTAAVLHSVAGVVPAGQHELNPQLHSVQSLVAELVGDEWRIVLYQNTPAAYHGRPELARALTDELAPLAAAGASSSFDGSLGEPGDEPIQE
jgi:uncharacterized protein (TIGR02246 family)